MLSVITAAGEEWIEYYEQPRDATWNKMNWLQRELLSDNQAICEATAATRVHLQNGVFATSSLPHKISHRAKSTEIIFMHFNEP